MQIVGSLDIFNILNIINILAYLNNPNILNIINILDILNFFFLTFRLLAHLDNDHETEDFVRVEGGTYSSHFIVNEVRFCLFVMGSFIICKQTWDVNIAKGTTDPRVEFILPKSYRKFKRKSWSNFIFTAVRALVWSNGTLLCKIDFNRNLSF